jgi:hypothetical protein
MGHTASRFQQDAGFTDGFSVNLFNILASNGVLTRNGVGDVSFNVGAAVTGTFTCNLLDGELLRTGFGEDLQEQFGGAQPSGSAQPQFYRPDLIGSMNTAQQLQPRTANKTKGMKLLGVAVTYLITGAALTAHTCRLDRTIFANNVALATTNMLASGANGLATATQANPYVTAITIPAAGQIYYTADQTELWFELVATTQAGGAYRLYNIRALWEFNFS